MGNGSTIEWMGKESWHGRMEEVIRECFKMIKSKDMGSWLKRITVSQQDIGKMDERMDFSINKTHKEKANKLNGTWEKNWSEDANVKRK